MALSKEQKEFISRLAEYQKAYASNEKPNETKKQTKSEQRVWQREPKYLSLEEFALVKQITLEEAQALVDAKLVESVQIGDTLLVIVEEKK